ncbi:MAG: ABC transporter substrate-binding protein [Candidatus Daviesbacteria bacterium]|nr:ABC transporter substrate-binding protein [Candidatus Daviesbacteria bacterium]
MKKNIAVVVGILLILLVGAYIFGKNKLIPSSSVTQQDQSLVTTNNTPSKMTLITTNVKSNQIPIVVALKKGFFQKYNIETNIEEVPKNSLQVLVSGKADAILITPNIALAAAVEGAEISWIGTVNNNNNWVVVSNKNIQEIKSMGVLSGLDKVNSLSLLQLLKVNTDNIQFQELADTQTKLTALKEKQVDSVGVAKTDWLLFKKKFNLSDDYQIILDSSVNQDAALPIAVIARNGFLEDKKTSENFIQALVEADYWIKNKENKEELIKLISEFYPNMPSDDAVVYADVYLSTLAGLNPIPDIKKGENILKLINNINPKARDYDINKFVSTKIITSLKESGFLNQFNF